MSSIVFLKFCVLCGQTKSVNKNGYKPKKLLLVEREGESDLGYVCDKCLKHMEDGKIFSKPRK